MRCGWFLELSGQLEDPVNFSAPQIRDSFQLIGTPSDKRPRATFFRKFLKAVPKPVRDPRKNVAAILLRAQEYLVALQSAYVEQADV